MKKRILIVDDEPKIIILLKDYLEREQFEVITASNGNDALEIFFEENNKIDLVLLDVMMPDLDGWTVCREIRKTSDVPVIMLTARSEDYDEVHGFEIGADDYVTKPVKPAALIARINAHFRRQGAADCDAVCIDGNIKIDRDSHIITVLDKEIMLSPKEFEVLSLLMENKNKLVSREKLLNEVWGYDYFGGLRTVDTHINRLRVKLLSDGERIATVRGYGYKFE